MEQSTDSIKGEGVMASLVVCTIPYSEIDYSLLDGRVRSFTLRGIELYDEQTNTRVENWKEQLIEFIQEQGLHIDRDGRGLHAFIPDLLQTHRGEK